MRSDHRHLTAYQIGCEVGQSVVLVLRPAILNRHILALDVAGFTNALPECDQKPCTIGRRPRAACARTCAAIPTRRGHAHSTGWFAIGFSRLAMASSERRQHPVLLERKDGTLVAWYCWFLRTSRGRGVWQSPSDGGKCWLHSAARPHGRSRRARSRLPCPSWDFSGARRPM